MIPPTTILVAVDFSDASSTALACAARLARQSSASLRVLHVEDPLLSAAAQESGIHLSAESREELGRLVDRIPDMREVPHQQYVVTGRPVEVILDVACREGADLIVVASHGMSGVARAVFGSVTEGLLHRTDRSVLVVPAEWRLPGERSGAPRLGPFVVGLDFSSSSTAAAGAACRLAQLFSTSVEVVHVVQDIPVLARWRAHAESALAERTDLARREVARIVGTLQAEAPVTSRVETGSIADRLAEIAAPWGERQPIIVLGKRSPDRGGTPGTVAFRVLTVSRVPVLMHVA
ncbi:MAG: universal stress protein [Vicinamibacterales bacterium]